MLATGLKIIGGEASLGTYASGGVAMTIPGMGNVLGVMFDPTIAGYVVTYAPSTGKVLMYKQTGASGVLSVIASGTATAATGTFLAFGF